MFLLLCLIVLQNNCILCTWSCHCLMANVFTTTNMLDCKCDIAHWVTLSFKVKF